MALNSDNLYWKYEQVMESALCNKASVKRQLVAPLHTSMDRRVYQGYHKKTLTDELLGARESIDSTSTFVALNNDTLYLDGN